MKKPVRIILLGLITILLLLGFAPAPAEAITTLPDYVSIGGVKYYPGDEIIELRDQYSKTVLGENGNLVMTSYLGSIHYEAVDGSFYPIQTDILPSGKPNWDWEVTAGHWQLYIKNDTTIGVRKDNNWVGTRLHGIAYLDITTKGYTILQTTNTVNPVISGNSAKWENILYGIDYIVHYTNDGFKEDIVIKQEARDLLASSGYRPIDYGYNTQNTFLVPIFEADWSQSLPMKLRNRASINPDEAEHEEIIYFESPVKDRYFNTNLVSFLPVDYAVSANPINPQDPKEEWEYASQVLRKRLVKKNDKHWLLIGAKVTALNQMPEGSIIFDPTETLRPSVAGDECNLPYEAFCSACPNHYDCVDEVSSDGDGTYIGTSSADYVRDLYNIAACTGSGTINHITVYNVAKTTSTPSQASLKVAIKSGTGTGAPDTVSESSAKTITTSWASYSNQWSTNPATSAAWTWDEIDKLQIGLAGRRTTISPDRYTLCTQVYVVVDYISPPTVTTQAVDNIVDTTATGHGTITDTGGEDASAWGVCWNTEGTPDTGDDTAAGSGAGGVGAFTASMTGLTISTKYYVRAYATNSGGTGYGSEVNFTTYGVPSVTTNAATSVEETTATLSGNITATNGANATVRGFEWGIATGVYTDNWTEDGDFGVAQFTHGLTSLTKGELYFYRALAINTYGVGYGSEVTFLTKPDEPNTFVATATSGTQINFTWVKGTGAQKTYIRGKDGSYPANRADGYEVYNDTGTSDNDTGLVGGHTYYYKAWSYATEGGKEQYSDLYDFAYASPELSLELWFQPTTMIIGTNLPDRATSSATNNGTITWGSNPSGVSVSLGSLSSGAQPTPGQVIEDAPSSVLPPVEVSDWYGDGTVSGSILTNPARPFVRLLSDNTTMTEIQAWRLLGLALLLFIIVSSAKALHGHQGITAIITAGALGALVAIDHNIFPLYLLVLVLGGLIAGIIAERNPSL